MPLTNIGPIFTSKDLIDAQKPVVDLKKWKEDVFFFDLLGYLSSQELYGKEGGHEAHHKEK